MLAINFKSCYRLISVAKSIDIINPEYGRQMTDRTMAANDAASEKDRQNSIKGIANLT